MNGKQLAKLAEVLPAGFNFEPDLRDGGEASFVHTHYGASVAGYAGKCAIGNAGFIPGSPSFRPELGVQVQVTDVSAEGFIIQEVS